MRPFSPRPDRVALLAVGAGLILVAAVAATREASPEWARTRADVRERFAARWGEEKAAEAVPSGLKQIWIPDLARVDRCVVCHATIDAADASKDMPNPAKSHPLPDLIAAHPFAKVNWATHIDLATGRPIYLKTTVPQGAVYCQLDPLKAFMRTEAPKKQNYRDPGKDL